MVRVRITVDAGRLVELNADGHVGLTGGPFGGNVVCSAVTAVIKATLAAIVEHRGVVVDGSAPEAGKIAFQVAAAEESSYQWLRGVTDVLVAGIRDLASDFPSEIELSVEGKRST